MSDMLSLISKSLVCVGIGPIMILQISFMLSAHNTWLKRQDTSKLNCQLKCFKSLYLSCFWLYGRTYYEHHHQHKRARARERFWLAMTQANNNEINIHREPESPCDLWLCDNQNPACKYRNSCCASALCIIISE